MNFKNINEIISHFDFQEASVDDLLKKLKIIRKSVYPDPSADGKFKDERTENLYHEVQSAIKFLKNKGTNLAVRKENSLANVLGDIVAQNKEGEIKKNINATTSELSIRLSDSIDLYHKKIGTPKLQGLMITGLITALWALPTVAKDHPLLSILYKYNSIFFATWIIALVLLGVLWLKVKNAETRDKEVKKSFKTESIQNHIFLLFSMWFQHNYKNYKYNDDKEITLLFSSDNLVEFVLTRYSELREYILRSGLTDDWEIKRRIIALETEHYFITKRSKIFKGFSFLSDIMPKPGELDIETAQLISDLIICRLTLKGVIKKTSVIGLSDVYEYKIR